MVKNVQGLIDHGTLESGVSHKWFDEFGRLIEWFVHADTDGKNNFWFDCQSTFNMFMSMFNIQMLRDHSRCG